MKQDEYLLNGHLGKLLLRFSVPCVLSLLVSALYNIVDQIFIGNSSVGAIGISATSIVYPLICIALAFGLLLGDGSAAYMSLCMGKGEKDKIGKAVGNALLLGLTISVIYLLIAFPFMEQILVALGAKTEASLEAAKEYVLWILIGFPPFILFNLLNPIVRADGAPKIAMASTLSGCILNIILDYVFVFPLGMGLTGAAMATTIGIIVSFLISFVYLWKSKCFRLSYKDFIPQKNIIAKIGKLGASSFLTQISIVIITIVSMNMLAKYGAMSKYGADDPQAIIGLVMKVFSIVINIGVGISAGAQPIIGCNYGAKRYDRVRTLYKYVTISIVILGVIATIIFESMPVQIIKIFGSNSLNPELYLEFGEKALHIYLSLILFTLVQKSSSIFLQSINRPLYSTLLSLIREVITFVPLTICLPLAYGLDGILYAAPCSDVFGLIFSIVFVVLTFRDLQKEEKETPLEPIKEQ